MNAGIRRWRSVSYYDSQPWSDDLWEESSQIFEADPVRYHPFVIWRRVPFEGETINVNEQGIRTTTGSDCTPGAYKVFAFGGSTMWGFGSPDWLSIPSLLQTELAGSTGRTICIVNYAEPAFVSTQGALQLLLELQKGNLPDLVIFLDGVNDVIAGYQNGRPGGHHNEDRIRALLNNSDHLVRTVLESSNSYELIHILTSRRSSDPVLAEIITDPRFAVEVGEVYLFNIALVSHMAERYGFDYQFFLQPVLTVGDKPLTEEEEAFSTGLDPVLVDLMSAVYEYIERTQADQAHFTSLSPIFDHVDGLVWIDAFHLTGDANRLVAAAIAESLLR
ncbi:MAG TPA: SGNH/GDSL hydrolase family protein [Anaerolineales bacterium]|nr:SGNH/GDSL hydrolase family protein [Anaerolineales bacterium]